MPQCKPSVRIDLMLRVKKRNFFVRFSRFNRNRRKLKLSRPLKYSRFHLGYFVAVFCIFTLSFATVFSTITNGVHVTAPIKPISTVSTNGKVGSSSPVGAVTAETIAAGKETTGKVSASSIKGTKTIPAKPGWVNKPLYTDPNNSAAQYVTQNPDVEGINYIARMSKYPVAEWFGDWNSNVKNDVNSYVSKATASGSVPVVVVYNIPNRDCGGYSIGGATAITGYAQWVQQVAAGIGNRTAVVVLEPDALGALDCLPTSLQPERTQSIAQAVTTLKANSQTSVYIDAGTPVWQPAKVMATRLNSANVAAADGFSINVSYFATTASNRVYGDQLSSLIGYKHYVIDTSRNGSSNAVTGMQCNPSFASLGNTPTTNTSSALNDALLWIKIPWESDGPCNGSPAPGVGYWSYAIQLAQRAGW